MNMKIEYQKLTGSFSDVYFNAKEKGNWQRINLVNYLYLTITGKMTRIVKRK